MEVSAGILKEADVLLAAFLTGALLLVVYDLLRIIRRLIPHKIWLVGAEDLVFWIGSAAVVFAFGLDSPFAEKADGICGEKIKKILSVLQKTIEKTLESS